MDRAGLVRPGMIRGALLLQPVPLLLFPPESFSAQSQQWWLPVLLAMMVAVADAQLLWRRSHQVWPWQLLAFAQGFNIISRLMMVWPHATLIVGGVTVFNTPYVLLSLLAMALSALSLWYLELPEVRQGLMRPEAG